MDCEAGDRGIVAAAELLIPRWVREVPQMETHALAIFCEALVRELHHLGGPVEVADTGVRIARKELLSDRTKARADIEHAQRRVRGPEQQTDEQAHILSAPAH